MNELTIVCFCGNKTCKYLKITRSELMDMRMYAYVCVQL